MDLTLFVYDGEEYQRMEESFAERAYSLEQVKKAIDGAGLVLAGFYAGDDMEAPVPDTQRWVFVTRHKEAVHGK